MMTAINRLINSSEEWLLDECHVYPEIQPETLHENHTFLPTNIDHQSSAEKYRR